MGVFSSKTPEEDQLLLLERRQVMIDEIQTKIIHLEKTIASLIPELRSLGEKAKTNTLLPGDIIRCEHLVQYVKTLDRVRALLANAKTLIVVCSSMEEVSQTFAKFNDQFKPIKDEVAIENVNRLSEQIRDFAVFEVEPTSSSTPEIEPETKLDDLTMKDLYDTLSSLPTPPKHIHAESSETTAKEVKTILEEKYN